MSSSDLRDDVAYLSVFMADRSMNDFDGPFIAKAVYSALFEEDRETLDPDVIPYALDAAVDTLRRQTPHPSRWALYVHTGV